MRTSSKVILGLGLGLSLSCRHALVAQSPQFDGVPSSTFFAPYRTAFASAYPAASPDRQLVQLGLPDTSTVVLWYARGAEDATRDVPLTISVDGVPVPQSRVSHTFNTTYRTGRVEIHGLLPQTRYAVEIAGAGLAPRTLSAATAIRGNAKFSFLVASCFAPYRTKPVMTIIDDASLASMRNLRRRAETTGASGPSFFIGLGDQMYTDPGATEDDHHLAYLYGKHSENIRGTEDEVPTFLTYLYRMSLALPDIDATLAGIPSVMMWDDHDIRDGWGSQGDEHLAGWQRYYRHARDAFVAFQASRNPNFQQIVNARSWTVPHREVSIGGSATFTERQVEEMPFNFDYGDMATFFVADARSNRRKGAHLVDEQGKAIEAWLENPARRNKPTVFVFSYPVPVAATIGKLFAFGQQVNSSNRDDAIDRIDRADRERLLELFVKHFAAQPRHVLVILSGDVHYSGLQSIHERNAGGRIYGYEVISSGLAQTEYNTTGPWVGSVSGNPRKVTLDLGSIPQPWVQDHGIYSGPSFAEVFISPPATDSTPPQIGLEFYPADFDGQAYDLNPGKPGTGWPHLIGAYPPNQRSKTFLSFLARFFTGNEQTTSALPEVLYKFWVTEGRASVVEAPR